MTCASSFGLGHRGFSAPCPFVCVAHSPYVNHLGTTVREAPRRIAFRCGRLWFEQIPSMADISKIAWLQLPHGVMLYLIER
jgi:hypothetical protein